jgi:hypothetical protein
VEALEAAIADGEDSGGAVEMVRVRSDRVVLTPSPAQEAVSRTHLR